MTDLSDAAKATAKAILDRIGVRNDREARSLQTRAGLFYRIAEAVDQAAEKAALDERGRWTMAIHAEVDSIRNRIRGRMGLAPMPIGDFH